MKAYRVAAVAILALILGVGLAEAAWRGHEQSGPPLPAIEASPQATSGSDPAKGGEPPSQPGAEQATTQSPLSTQEVVRRLISLTARRHQALRSYTALRHYHLEYHGIGHDVADMDVRVRYNTPGPKLLTVISESGSGMLRDHVLDPLIKQEEAEAEIESQTGSVFVPENYAFTLVDYPRPGIQPDYVLAIKPRPDAQRRFLFKGKIWLDPNDFGMVRAEGRSVRSPSFWISHFDFVYLGQRINGFWLPASNQTVAHLRLFGHAVLNITYTDFDLTSFHPLDFVAQGALP